MLSINKEKILKDYGFIRNFLKENNLTESDLHNLQRALRDNKGQRLNKNGKIHKTFLIIKKLGYIQERK
ncbi:hypothetical protein [Helicobacter pullorum]|uniref:Uncharacterized protein n=1 Tax=Helicobacter pullorum TaxID=35818 RepID=A0A0N1EA01_9HELI|nr:hypothetical protein [Helicobacter pullorum]KAB0574528.1 hypothetical protein F7P74_06230 [Helicobacter pullorum NCTC 12824]KPH54715.1 hypothetical protein HPU229334_00430 [Helicobacter pullorum]